MTSGNGAVDRDEALDRAADLALELRTVIDDLSDPDLRVLIDRLLFAVGERIARKLSDRPN